MVCPFGCLSSIAAAIVAIQFFAKVVPWLYEVVIGPYFLGPKLKLRDYGEWACKYKTGVEQKIDTFIIRIKTMILSHEK